MKSIRKISHINPSLKGTYIFFSCLKSVKEIPYNKKKESFRFPKGWYAYVGSAFNTGGLKSRLNRHFHGSGKSHWNIDFFRKSVIPYNQAWVSYQDKKLEREWSSAIQLLDNLSVPVIGFGNSDDRGKPLISGVKKSHLFHFTKKPKLEVFQAIVDEYFPDNDKIIQIKLPI